MKRALSVERLAQLWGQLERQFGTFKQVVSVSEVPSRTLRAVLATCQFATGSVGLRVVVDDSLRVAGLFVQRVPTPGPGVRSTAEGGAPKELSVSVGAEFELAGYLTLPAGEGPFPAAILVHGSGPSDADGTQGNLKPLRDMALGLAERGVASLRYEKRSLRHPASAVTVGEEVLDDVGHALDSLAKCGAISEDRVVVIGWSFGGYLGPWIAHRYGAVAGLVMINAPARPIHVLLAEQMARRSDTGSLGGSPSMADELARVDALDLRPEERVLGATGAYYLALRGYAPLKTAASLDVPILVVQGTADCQVSAGRDYEVWRRALSAGKQTSFVLFPGLNHMLIRSGSELCSPDRFEHGHVDRQALDGIAAWVKQVPSRAGRRN